MGIARISLCALVLATAACAGIFGIDDISYVPVDDGGGGPFDSDGGVSDEASTTSRPIVAGTVLWLDSAIGVNNLSGPDSEQPNDGVSVDAWRDISSRGHNVQSASVRPTFAQSDYSGFPDIDFSTPGDDGGSASLSSSSDPDFHFGSNDFSIFVVAGYQDGPSGAFVSEGIDPLAKNGFSFGPAPLLAFDTRGAADASADFAVTSTQTFDDGSLHLFVARRFGGGDAGGATLELRVDGQSIAVREGAANVDVSTNEGVVVGSVTEVPLNGAIADVLIVNGPISSSDLTLLETYFIQAYGLASQ